MKSAVAEAIGEFFARGGKITKCPDGIGLGEGLRPKELRLIGKALSDRDKVISRAVRIGAFLDAFPGIDWTVQDLEAAFAIGEGSTHAALRVLLKNKRAKVTRGRRRRLLYRSVKSESEAA